MFDVAIIGSGIGGLLSAVFLSKEGYKVCLIEKNKQLGGNLQAFSKEKELFDTGVHYLGGLDKGQNLYQIFKYAGLMDKLKLEKMDEGFDKILIEGKQNSFTQSQGWEVFKSTLISEFPEEAQAIENYHQKVIAVCEKFPLYHLKLEGDGHEKFSVMNEGVKEVIESITSNKTLQSVLVGNNILYASVGNKTPFYVHALVVNSYIQSSWKLQGGGSQIVKILSGFIRNSVGEILRNKEVKEIVERDELISHLVLEDGSIVESKQFISAISPAETLKMLHSEKIRSRYRLRIENRENTISSFSFYIVLKAKTIRYENCNYYYQKGGRIWSLGDYDFDEWPLGYGLYFNRDRKNPEYASSISVLTLMKFEDVKKWRHTFHTSRYEVSRGVDYERFKYERSEKLLDLVYEKFPQLMGNISSFYAATPLTNRDYIGQRDGAIYGVQKDNNTPLENIISPRTKIPNLFLTGQNINLHGILGTSLSAILTCTMLLGDNSLIDKIKNA